MDQETASDALRCNLVKELKKLAEKLLIYGLRSMVLSGSYARGEEIKESDVDVIIVAEGFRGMAFYEREYLVLRNWSCEKPLEPWCYTPEEAELAIHDRPRIDILDAIEYGIVVYDDGFWKYLRKRYSEKPFKRRRVDPHHESIIIGN